MTTTRCRRAGCDGEIEGGYCSVCGHAAASEPTATPAPDATAAAPPPDRAAQWAAGTQRAPASGTASSSRRGSVRTSTSGPSRGQLGAGLVEVPAVLEVDPATALLDDPRVPEDKRFCSLCGHPVGRGRDGRPGRADGFCPKDCTPFSFSPKLERGTLVEGQYDVQGCLAHGGLGWIYLAIDRKVSDRWVVLKGLLDSGDAAAMAAAAAERRFLAEVSHHSIVKIYNFVEHAGADGRPVGYIVMEYVGGSSLRQLLEARRRPDRGVEPFPVAQAIAYALEALPALGHLHGKGLAYCDFKPDNVIQYDRQLKLIDLGAVIRLADERSAVYGTIGYQAPEIATRGPSPASDIHTVGRTLAVLALGISPALRGSPTPLPDPAEHPVLAAHESFHHLLLRATDPDPEERFGSADEFADQLHGVLREVLSTEDGRPRPAASTVFSAPRGTFAGGLLDTAAATGTAQPGRPDPVRVAAALPIPLVDPADPAAGLLAAAADREQIGRLTASTADPGTELRLALVRAHLDAGDAAAATEGIDGLAADDLGDWRLDWYRGVAAHVAGDAAAAVAAFERIYAALPGEAAPKLALAVASECGGNDGPARPYYRLLGRTDPGLADALFGLARVELRAGDRAGAIQALDAVPETSSCHVAAQLAAVRVTQSGRTAAEIGEAALRGAAARVERLPLDPATDERVRTTLLTTAVELVAGAGPPLLGCPWRERDLRLALERSLRRSGRLTPDADERIELVDRANAVRPRSWV